MDQNMKFHELPDSSLALIASAAFMLGLTDGRAGAERAATKDVFVAIMASFPKVKSSRNVDRKKVRQVYGAGYDVAIGQKKRDGKRA